MNIKFVLKIICDVLLLTTLFRIIKLYVLSRFSKDYDRSCLIIKKIVKPKLLTETELTKHKKMLKLN